ncbi:hypothetical protein J6590_063238 [Homalodisca vitripennis]|nr:hypothetical protein J6590_063238 [Homalodisca vitripennis]
MARCLFTELNVSRSQLELGFPETTLNTPGKRNLSQQRLDVICSPKLNCSWGTHAITSPRPSDRDPRVMETRLRPARRRLVRGPSADDR